MPRKPVVIYRESLKLPGLVGNPRSNTLLKAFNEAWGFPGGACNKIEGGQYVDAKPFPEGFEEAQAQLYRSELVYVEVSVYKDGSRKLKLVGSPEKDHDR